MTLKAMLEAAGHRIVEQQPEVSIADSEVLAIACARSHPALVLATANRIADAVLAMKQGVFGYIFVPLQPGEAEVMVGRALERTARIETVPAAEATLEAVEANHIVETLRACKNNQAQAARMLGIGRNTLWRKLKKIEAP